MPTTGTGYGQYTLLLLPRHLAASLLPLRFPQQPRRQLLPLLQQPLRSPPLPLSWMPSPLLSPPFPLSSRMSSPSVSNRRGRRAACCCVLHEQLQRHVLAATNTRFGYDQYAFWLPSIRILATTNTRSGYNQYAFWVRPIRALTRTIRPFRSSRRVATSRTRFVLAPKAKDFAVAAAHRAKTALTRRIGATCLCHSQLGVLTLVLYPNNRWYSFPKVSLDWYPQLGSPSAHRRAAC